MRQTMLVVMPDCGEPPGGVYRTAVTPPGAAVTAKQTITYGLGAKNTVTLSSRDRDGCMLALQRDIVTLSGELLERQEIPLPPLKSPEWALAAAGALLAAGCPPEDLYREIQETQ
ncbi:MAG: hypothetical protein LBR72_08890 [Oscillospiraceae bacterium]|jgi:hypothetical protein|nr:hypothetical protein [Oscillospiraceae bacterium]